MSIFSLSLGLYKLLLFLYPGEFRRAYGEEMWLLFREMCFQEWCQRGRAGLVRFWRDALFDLLANVFLLHSEKVAVSALAGAMATAIYGTILLLVEPRLSCPAVSTQPESLAIGIGVQGALPAFTVAWMSVLCGFMFFRRTRQAFALDLNFTGTLETAAVDKGESHLRGSL